MTRVVVFGTFDRLHPGHLHFLAEAKSHGDELYVVLARECTIREKKGKAPKYSEIERKQHLELTGIPDKILFGRTDDKYAVLEEARPDIICLGYDQKHFVDELPAELKKRRISARILRLGPFKEDIFKSSKLK